MARTIPLPGLIRRHPWLSGFIAILVAIMLALLGLRLWIGSDGGRTYIESQIEGRKAGRYGTISIDGLSGDPLSELHVDRLTLRDESGIWLDARNLNIDWSPMALLSRKVRLDLARAETIEVLRRPVLSEPGPKQSSSGSWSVSLSEVGIGELKLAQGVAGPASAFAVEGRFAAPSGKTLHVALSAEPLEGAGDRIEVALDRNEAGAFTLDANIDAPAGGTLATLAGLNEGDAAALKAEASGTLKEGDGFATLTISGQTTADLTAKIAGGDLTANAKIDASHLPIASRLRDLIGPNAEIALTADTRKRTIPFSTRSKFASGRLSLDGNYLSRKNALDGPLLAKLDFSGLKALTGQDLRLAFSGEIIPSTKSPSADGKITLATMEGTNLPFEQLEGPLTVDTDGSRIAFSSVLTGQGVFRGNRTAEWMAGAAPTLDLKGAFDRENGDLTFAPSRVALARGSLTAEGRIDTRDRTLDLKGQLNGIRVPATMSSDLRADGSVTASGTLSSPLIAADLRVNGVGTLNGTLAELTGPAPRIRARIQRDADTWSFRSIDIAGDHLMVSGNGRYGPDGSILLSGRFSQSAPLTASGAQINLAAGEFRLAGTGGVQQVDLTSNGGRLVWQDIELDDLAVHMPLRKSGSGWQGPVELEGKRGGVPATLTTRLSWQDGVLKLSDITGDHATISISGDLTYGPEGQLSADLSASGDRYAFGERSIGEFRIDTALNRSPGEALDITASGEIADVVIAPGLRFDRVTGRARNAPEGYNFTTHLVRDHTARPSDLSISGSALLDAGTPSGQIEIDGTLLGERVVSQRPISWHLGDTPAVDVELAVFGGLIDATAEGAGDDASLIFRAESVDLSPVLASAGIAAPGSILNGQGKLFLFGENPRGDFALSASGPIPGVEESFDLDLKGRLGSGALTLNGHSAYGGELEVVSELTIPIEARPSNIARPDMDAPLRGTSRLSGDLAVLRSVALAYGHDIGGTADGKARISGTLRAPEITAGLGVEDGLYEFGTTGLRLRNVTMDASYAGNALSVGGTADGADGGTAKFKGRLSGDTTDLNATFSDLLLYNRDGDTLRAGGDITLTGDTDGRKVSGDLRVQSARLSIDNLPSARAKAIDVRWKEDGETEAPDSRLRRTLELDLGIKADRRVFISGRGLESEWGANLRLTGTPAAPRLSGQTDLIRGTLDLAGRPFVFDAGAVYFDGPIDRARLDVNAERTVNGFSVRVALTGSPLRPGFELSSTPDLPEDEILSRLLFGRSSVDLSALEAAQLASSIARLSGNSAGFDPTSELQAALGIDRLRLGTTEEGAAQIGIGQYLADDVYLELNSAGAEGSSVEVEWEPRPQISVTSETKTNGEARVSIRWKKDY